MATCKICGHCFSSLSRSRPPALWRCVLTGQLKVTLANQDAWTPRFQTRSTPPSAKQRARRSPLTPARVEEMNLDKSLALLRTVSRMRRRSFTFVFVGSFRPHDKPLIEISSRPSALSHRHGPRRDNETCIRRRASSKSSQAASSRRARSASCSPARWERRAASVVTLRCDGGNLEQNLQRAAGGSSGVIQRGVICLCENRPRRRRSTSATTDQNGARQDRFQPRSEQIQEPVRPVVRSSTRARPSCRISERTASGTTTC